MQPESRPPPPLPGVVFVLRLKTTNPLNGNSMGSRFAAAGQKRRHRETARIVTLDAMRQRGFSPVDLLPCVVTLRRLSPSMLDPHDGLPASCKSIVDGIADALGINDGGPFVQWQYHNKKCRRGFFGVEVDITRRSTP